MRRVFGEPRTTEPSRFLQEIPRHILREAEDAYAVGSKEPGGATRWTF